MVVEDRVVCLVVASKVELVSWKTAPGVVEATLEELDSTTATARADEVAVVATAARGVDEEVATTAAADEDTEEDPEDPKLLEAVVDAPLLTSTLLTITTSPLSAVTFTSTVVVPNPEACSKKL